MESIKLEGLRLVDVISDNKTATTTIGGRSVIVSNDGDSTITVTLNDIEIPVLAGEILGPEELDVGRFTRIVMTATATAYRVFVYGVE